MYISLNMLEPMDEVISVTGTPVRGAGWYGPTYGLHTVVIQVQNFQGRISIQAALTADPIDSDWFSVLPGNVAYIQYPQRNYIVGTPETGESSNYGFSFFSNVVWLRAIVDRSYLIPTFAYPACIGAYGLVNYILLNY